MEVFDTPNWDLNSCSEKIWKDTFSVEKTKGKVKKVKENKLVKKKSKKKLKAKLKHIDLNVKINNQNKAGESQVIKKQIPKRKERKKINRTNIKLTTKIKEKPKQSVIVDPVQLQLPQVSRKTMKNMSLREKMMAKLKAAKFRYLNEQMYTSDGKTALRYFENDPDSYKAYHEGYQLQVTKWPLNPLDIIIRNIKRMPEHFTVADFGCGEARLAKSVPQKVHSFDLIALNEDVQVCDMAHVPLESSTVDVVVFCLSLMGTNLKDYLLEANRVLKMGGIMKIAEVESRFESVEEFIKKVKLFGFQFSRKDLSHNLFYFIDFKKKENVSKKHKLEPVNLKPCFYKKR